MSYLSMDCHQLEEKESELIKEYQALKAQELNINMTRGKPCKEQLDLSEPMLTGHCHQCRLLYRLRLRLPQLRFG